MDSMEYEIMKRYTAIKRAVQDVPSENRQNAQK